MKIIDAHSHIDYITHNFQQDVVRTVCCTTDESQWQSLIDIMNLDKYVYGAFGVHPWFVSDVRNGFENRLYDLLKTDETYMVGEIGLDKHKPDMEKQLEVFQKQFDIAVQLNRPVFLHCVGAWDKILNIFKQYQKDKMPIIIAHDFHGSKEIIKTLLDSYNVMFSFNKIDKPQFIQCIPKEKLLVETDGKTDVLLMNVVGEIANITNNVKICDIIYNNMQRVFKHG